MDYLPTGPLGERVPRWNPSLIEAELSDLSGLSKDLDELVSRTEWVGPLLAGLCRGSGYLKNLVRRFPDFAAAALIQSPQGLFEEILVSTASSWRVADSQADLMSRLRVEKGKAAFLIALCDLAGWWDAETVTRELSIFADAALSAAINFQLASAASAGKVALADPDNPSADCGYFIFGMGKYGAHELNYSSDIDLIAFFEAEQKCLRGQERSARLFHPPHPPAG